MPGPISRRDFLRTGAAASAALASAAGTATAAPAGAPLGAPHVRRLAVEPVVVASPNGHWYRNGGPVTGVEQAYAMVTQGADVLDAVIAGVTIVELDPEEDSVGFGGLPNADGVVQLDSCCMHGPKRRAGGVAALEGVRTPSQVARAVLHQTDHHLLVGAGAQHFARNMGFPVEGDLNTPHSRKVWLEWKRRTDPQHYLDPEKREEEWARVVDELRRDGVLRPGPLHGTINCSAVSAAGDVCGVTTTSGLAWKIPGRVGDSPILGAGLYVDGAVGAAGSTGRGEANLFNLSSYLVVEEMRRGAHPKDAGMAALRRIRDNTVERRLRNARGLPNFNVSFYVLDRQGRHAGVALYAEDESERGWAGQTAGRLVRYSVCDRNGARTLPVEGLLPGLPEG